jgi:D-amino-acid dehydrogenase
MSGAGRHAVVVGGGVIGTACAHFLTESGWRVTILDRGAFGAGASHGNCGLVCPSHVLPLAEPGAVVAALKAMLRPSSPFAIRFRLDPALWSWLLRFARRCNEADMIRAARGIQPLLESSLQLYDELIRREGLDCEWERRGLLYAYRSPAAMDAYAPIDRLLRESFGVPAERLDGAALTEREPALKPGLAGAWYYQADSHLRPDRLMRSWRRLLESRGVTIRERTALLGFARRDGSASAARTDSGAIEADAFVVAAGAWTPMLRSHLGCRVPIQPGKGYSLTMPRPAACPTIPLIFPETRVVATPFRSGYRLGSTMEFAGYDATINPRRLQLLRDGAAPYLREPHCVPIEEEWTGWRPMTFDSLPIIDRSPAMSNVLVAAGHNMLGLSMAPATGRLVADLLEGRPPHIDPAPYRVGRFG